MALEWDVEGAIARMKVGESFFIPTLRPMDYISNIYNYARLCGIYVVCKHAMQEGVLGVRTWRVEPRDVREPIDTPWTE